MCTSDNVVRFRTALSPDQVGRKSSRYLVRRHEPSVDPDRQPFPDPGVGHG